MEQLTLTMAGQQATAGDARLHGGSCGHPAASLAGAQLAVPASYRHHNAAEWRVIVEPTTVTSVVFDGKDRRPRQPSELSP